MASLYADGQFPQIVIQLLRNLEHNILTIQEGQKANQRIPDEEVLAFAIRENRTVLTVNRSDFICLHNLQPNHAGIIVCNKDLDRQRLSQRINQAIIDAETLDNKLIRVNRPS